MRKRRYVLKHLFLPPVRIQRSSEFSGGRGKKPIFLQLSIWNYQKHEVAVDKEFSKLPWSCTASQGGVETRGWWGKATGRDS